MGAYKDYLNYLGSLGLQAATDYDFRDKDRNTSLEVERMLNRSCMMFQWHGLPETIPQQQLEKILQTQGYAIIGEINGNLYACYGGLGGVLDEYYRPTKATVSIPYLNFNGTWEIGVDCVIIRNDLNAQGLLPIYSKYASIMVETELTIMLTLINNRVQSHIVASDNRSIESAKDYIKGLEDGKVGVIADNTMFENVRIFEKQRTDDITRLKELLQYYKGSLYNEIGIATMYDMKKERITQADLELNTESLYPLIDNMMLRRKEGIGDCAVMFGVDWGVEFNSSWDYRYNHGEPIVTGRMSDVGKGDGSDWVDGDTDMPFTGNFGNEGDIEGNKDGLEGNGDTLQDISDSVDVVADNDSSDSLDVSADDVVNGSEMENRDKFPDDVLMEVEDGIIELADRIADVIVDGVDDGENK